MKPLAFLNSVGDYLNDNLTDPFPDIPGDLQLPFIGSTIDLTRDMNGTLEQLWKKHGDVFKLRIFGANVIMMVGPEINKLALQEKQDEFLSREAWSIILGDLFKGAIMLSDGEEHKRFRRIMQTAFHRKPMKGYLDVIVESVNDVIDNEIEMKEEKVKIYPIMEKLTLRIAGKLFFGVDFKEKHLTAIREVTHASADPLHLNLPLTAYGKGLRSRKMLTEFYNERISANRKNPGNDLFSYMCIARSEQGESFTDEEIIDQMIFLMMASHDTTASALTALIYETAKDQFWQDKMRAESLVFQEQGEVSYERLKEFELIGQVINETLRLHPSLMAFPRMTTRDFEFNGYKIPAYSYVGICPKLSHLREDVFPNPWRFDPDRFSAERAEHKKHSHAFIPFGAGNHVCIGKYFAEMEAKIIVHHFIRKFRWTADKHYEAKFIPPLNHPKDGLPVKLEKL